MPPSLEGILAEHRRRLEAFAAGLVEPYLARIRSLRADPNTPVAPSAKEFNDPVWGTVVLRPHEVVVLDSPLLQRLRRIRQLGVAHWVYPAANHTRLEHTLGVVHQVQSLVTAINERADQAAMISDSYEELLRLAALMHDVGHGVMSHVSENAVFGYEDTAHVRDHFADEAQVEEVKLSEIGAFYIAGSPAVRDLVALAVELSPQPRLPSDPIPLVKRAIIGQSIADEAPLLHELVSGPFDADKLDYMTRDALMTGVPTVTDVPRLTQKVRALAVPAEELPPQIARSVSEGPTTYTIIGVALSGARTLDELMFGRTLLFDKIYRHQKVRAIESMVRAVFALLLAEVAVDSPGFLPYRFDDDEFINLDADGIGRLRGTSLDSGARAADGVAAKIISMIRGRQLYVRAFAFGRNMPLDPYRADPDQRRGFERLARDAADRLRAERLVERITQAVRDALERLQLDDLLAEFGDEWLSSFITLDPPEAGPGVGDTCNALVFTSGGQIIRFKDETAEAPAWTSAYPLARELGYVFSPPALAPYTCLAVEKILRDEYGIRSSPAMFDYSKQQGHITSTLRRELAKRDFYAGSSMDLRPIPERLTRADVGPRLSQIHQKLAAYQGPNGAVATPVHLKAWLRQFQDEGHVEQALDLLERVELVGRPEVVSAARAFLTAHPTLGDAYICPLGAAKDSSSICTSLIDDTREEFGFHSGEIGQLARDEKGLLFFDDFISSGCQAISIFERWLGEEPTGELNEDRPELNEPGKQDLRNRRVGIVFAAGQSSGKDALQARLSELGVNATVYVHLVDDALPRAFGHEARTSADDGPFADRCREIGQRLLDNGNIPADKLAQRALGYGNHAFLVVFPYNTPAQTLTCLWSEGKLDEGLWTPAFPRRKKH